MSQFQTAFREHRRLLVICLLYVLCATPLILAHGGSWRNVLTIIGYHAVVAVVSVSFVFAILGLYFILSVYEAKWQGSALAWGKSIVVGFESRLAEYAASGMIQRAFWGLVALFPLLTFFSMTKSMIPHVGMYRWDPWLSAADKFLHFGHLPQEWLMPVAQRWRLVTVLDDAYIVWFLVMFAANGYCLFCDRVPERRMRYLWSFTLCWIISGTLLAFLLASCGPMYFHSFYPQLLDPYAGLNRWLQTARAGRPVATREVAQYLYHLATGPVWPTLNGISAMPSQHVAIAWLIALYARQVNRAAGWVMFGYALLILLGSITLGWHYAVDGYVGIMVVGLIWWTCGLWQRTQ